MEMNPSIYSQLVFDNGVKTHPEEERESFQLMVLRILDIYMQKIKTRFPPTLTCPLQKNHLEMDQRSKCKT